MSSVRNISDHYFALIVIFIPIASSSFSTVPKFVGFAHEDLVPKAA
jgi:hypothetical protein